MATNISAQPAGGAPAGQRLGYVIYSPDTGEYLASVADAGPMNVLAWCRAPDEALRWDSIVEAEQAAHDRMDHQTEPGNRSFTVEVSELLDTGDQLLARPAAQVLPPDARILSAAERMALAFSADFRPTADRLGIRAAHARAVVERPDRITHHVASSTTFYIRGVAGLRPERHLLVVVDGTAARPQVVAAWPVPVSVAGASPSPMSALHALCVAVGNPMLLRGERMPVVLGERHPELVSDPAEVIRVEDDRIGVLQARIGRDPDTGEMLIGWAYSIDDDRLMALLR